MKLEWLDDFLALAAEGSFSRAAKNRNVAQPAFSRRIRLLEEWVGVTLFERKSQPIELTDSGRQLKPLAENITRQLYQGRENIRQSEKGTKVLKFAATHTISILFFPDWLSSVIGEGSETHLSLESNHMDTCAAALTHGLCHFMICVTHSDADLGFDTDLYESIVIGTDYLIPVSAPDETGRPRHRIPGKKGEPAKYLYFSEASALGQIVDSMIARRGEPTFIKKYSSSPLAGALKSMAESGLGVTWITSMLASISMNNGTLVQAGDDSWRIPVEIRIFRSKGNLPPIAVKFWNSIQPMTNSARTHGTLGN